MDVPPWHKRQSSFPAIEWGKAGAGGGIDGGGADTGNASWQWRQRSLVRPPWPRLNGMGADVPWHKRQSFSPITVCSI